MPDEEPVMLTVQIDKQAALSLYSFLSNLPARIMLNADNERIVSLTKDERNALFEGVELALQNLVVEDGSTISVKMLPQMAEELRDRFVDASQFFLTEAEAAILYGELAAAESGE